MMLATIFDAPQPTHDIPKSMRPPRVWPAMALAALTLVLGLVTAYETYQQAGRTDKVEVTVQENRSLVCSAARARQTITPETALEYRLREVTRSTDADCLRTGQ